MTFGPVRPLLYLACPLLAALTLGGCDDDAATTPGADGGAGGCVDCAPPCPPEDEVPAGFVCAPAGEFWMGSPSDEMPRDDDEERHLVRLTQPFYIALTEVTQEEWSAVIADNPAWFQAGGDGPCDFEPCPPRPVERVSWYEALEWLNAKSEMDGLSPCYTLTGCSGDLGFGCEDGEDQCLNGYRCSGVEWDRACDGYRLPTEAEWEYAARAGSDAANYAPLDDIAWYVGTSRGRTRPVGSQVANAWGLVDVYGNVLEWVWDIYAMNYGFFGRAEVAIEDPEGEAFGDTRVIRGCSWNSDFSLCRAAARDNAFSAQLSFQIGFRMARSVR